MSGTQSDKSVQFFYAVGKKNTIQVKHIKQKGEQSEYEIVSYKTKSEKLVSGAESIDESEFTKAIDRAALQIKTRLL